MLRGRPLTCGRVGVFEVAAAAGSAVASKGLAGREGGEAGWVDTAEGLGGGSEGTEVAFSGSG